MLAVLSVLAVAGLFAADHFIDTLVERQLERNDLIRSATMEAFFPLISIAIIYYILTWLMTKLVRLINVKLERSHKARRIKGVDV